MTSRSGYSHKDMMKRAIEVKIRRAKTMVDGDNPNPDMAIRHPEWIRAAQQKNYTELIKDITLKTKKFQENTLRRRDKTAGKN